MSDERTGLSRRSFLRLSIGSGLAALAGCPGSDQSPEPTHTPVETERTAGPETPDRTRTPETRTTRTPTNTTVAYADRYDTVVNVVEDGGADRTGASSIVPVLDQYADDDTLLYFPPGEYRMDEIWRQPQFANLGILGNDATVVPPSGYTGYLFTLGLPGRPSHGLLFEGLSFDFRDADSTPRPIQVLAQDDVVIRDVLVRGTTGTARFDITDPDGEGLIERLRMPDGGVEDPYPVGCFVGTQTHGSLTFRDCHISGFPGNGLYASAANGRVTVDGGMYANNDIANVRVSGPAEVRNVHVRCDSNPSGYENMRGIRLRHGGHALVENCTIEMIDISASGGAIVVGQLLDSATIRNTDITASSDRVPAINVRSPRNDEGDTSVECENVTVTGTAGGGAALRIVDRTGCELRDTDISQTGEDRDGLHLIRSDPAILDDLDIDVTGESIVRRE